MTNMIKLKTNFADKVNLLQQELSSYFELVEDYEQYADFSFPRRTMIIYPGGSTQKSWYSNRKQSLKKQRVDEYELYDALSIYLYDHKANTTTLSAKYLTETSSVIESIKKDIEKELGCDLSTSEAIVGQRYPNFLLYPHVDGDEETNRYHLIISTNDDNYFKDCNGIVHRLTPGDIWQLDVTKEHEVGNLGNTPVRYMIIDEK